MIIIIPPLVILTLQVVQMSIYVYSVGKVQTEGVLNSGGKTQPIGCKS